MTKTMMPVVTAASTGFGVAAATMDYPGCTDGCLYRTAQNSSRLLWHKVLNN